MDDQWLLTVEALAGAGADAIEVGIPFSDPMIDGPTIQEASLRALERGTTPDGILADLSRIDVGVPAGGDDLLQPGPPGRARPDGRAPWPSPGVAGAIVPDLPLEELDPWSAAADAAGVATVLLVAPSTPPDRVRAICARSRGFVYAVGRMGVTGEQAELADSARQAGRAGPGRHRPCRCAWGSGSPPPNRRPRSARWPTVWWSARRWCAACWKGPGPRGPPTSSPPCARALDAG